MYDGWTNNSTHYIDMYALYNRTIKLFEQGRIVARDEPFYRLLSVIPMAAIDRTNDTATQFSSEVHIRHFEDVFHFMVFIYIIGFYVK